MALQYFWRNLNIHMFIKIMSGLHCVRYLGHRNKDNLEIN
jgi:hypothetical protein